MADDNNDTAIINTLIATTLDSVKGYREASEDAQTTNSAFFGKMADERSQVATELQAYVRSIGGDPEDDSTISGATHRGFMKLKEAIMGSDEKAVIDEVERGEDYIKSKFETALESDDLSPAARAETQKAYRSVREGHDRVSAMKHSMA